MLAEDGYRSQVHCRATRGNQLGTCAKAASTKRSRVRARGEHVFGHMATAMGATLIRTIGLARAKAKIGMVNLAYNMSRHVTLLGMSTFEAYNG